MSSLKDIEQREKIEAFATAIIHWLSEFPRSPIGSETTVEELVQPSTLYRIFKILFLREDMETLQNDKWFLENQSVTGTSILHIHEYTMKQVEILDGLLDYHLRAKVDLNLTPHLNLYKLIIFQDHYELKKICQILFKIGTFTSRLSTNGLAYFEFLTDVDKNSINQFKEKILSIPTDKRKKNKYPGLREKTMPPVETNSDYESTENRVGTGIGVAGGSGSGSGSGSCYYIDEEEWDALNWENSIFENLIYKLAREMNN